MFRIPFLAYTLIHQTFKSEVMCKHIRLTLSFQGNNNGLISQTSFTAAALNGLSTQVEKPKSENQNSLDFKIYSSIASVLQVCVNLKELKQAYAQLIITGIVQNIFLNTQLIIKYVMLGYIENARQVFDQLCERDVVLWNAMIRGYVKNGLCEEAFKLYCQMKLESVQPDKFTFPCVLKACASLSALQEGKGIHGHVIRNGLESDAYVGDNLVYMYSKCRSIKDARRMFDKMTPRTVVSWTKMIAGYAQNGIAKEALVLFHEMQLAGVEPDSLTIVIILPACADLGALKQGKWIHHYVVRNGFGSDIYVGTALIDMYAKCGSIEVARQLFDKMSKRDVISWNAMIAGYGMHGLGEDALAIFAQMQEAHMKPDNATFVGVLSACSHAGLVDKGWDYFGCMSRDYYITPSVEHCACMVDLLGRAGRLEEARDFIEEMPLEPDTGVWGALLGACRIHCNIELGEHAAEHLFRLAPGHSGYYVLLSNIYAGAGRWDDMEKLRTMMKSRGVKKIPGWSLIEVNREVHEFHVGDNSHPLCEKNYAMLETLAGQMEGGGFVHDTNLVLCNMED